MRPSMGHPRRAGVRPHQDSMDEGLPPTAPVVVWRSAVGCSSREPARTALSLGIFFQRRKPGKFALNTRQYPDVRDHCSVRHGGCMYQVAWRLRPLPQLRHKAAGLVLCGNCQRRSRRAVRASTKIPAPSSSAPRKGGRWTKLGVSVKNTTHLPRIVCACLHRTWTSAMCEWVAARSPQLLLGKKAAQVPDSALTAASSYMVDVGGQACCQYSRCQRSVAMDTCPVTMWMRGWKTARS